jgi:transcription initiation factor TFIID subunit 12
LVGQRLKDLVTSLDPNYTLDEDAETQILQLADDFLEKVTKQSIRLAQHRGSKTVDVQDIQLTLAKQWGIVVPGLGPPNLKPPKPSNRVVAGSASRSGSGKRRASSGDSGGQSIAKKAKSAAAQILAQAQQTGGT